MAKLVDARKNPIMTRKDFLHRNKNLISRLYNGIHTIYGPYIAKDNRRRVILYDGLRRITRQYAKLKMEIKLGRRISSNETVDHMDRDTLNDKYTNLQILDRSTHVKKDVTRLKVGNVHNCGWCKNKFKLTLGQTRDKKKAGPFCSRSCAGSYGAAIQNGKLSKMKRQKINRVYYKN